MQTTLVQRYLGNKTPMTQSILDIVETVAQPGDLVVDAFSGSLAVSAAFRAAGYEVAPNDINHFSWLFSRAYFTSQSMPWPNGTKPRGARSKSSVWARHLENLVSTEASELPALYNRTDIFDHYCEEGPKSAFTSKRGSSGRRRFFSPANAASIDRALNRIRFQYRNQLIDETTRCILTAALISAVEKVSNTQGTYHDFPRGFIDDRALRPLKIVAPDEAVFHGPESRFIGRAEDSLDFVSKLPRHRALYLDPPYNFRQYTAYYFMLNLLSSHAEIEDLDGFFSKVQFVRGQNMESDFKSTFCNKASFIPSLKTLIDRADAEVVILSYFDGRNHWGEFKKDGADTQGRRLLEEFFAGELFKPGSQRLVPVARKNYQSYGGYTAKPIQEFLFVAEKRTTPSRKARVEPSIGLDDAGTAEAGANMAGRSSRRSLRPRSAA